MWMSVDQHLLCPNKSLNSKFLLIMLTYNEMYFIEMFLMHCLPPYNLIVDINTKCTRCVLVQCNLTERESI